MDYAAWKLFVDLTEAGSLSKVALAHGTSQPRRRRLGDLERECGGRLFERTGRGVVPTELGRQSRPGYARGSRAPMSSPMTYARRPARRSGGSGSGACRRRRIRSVTTLYYRLKRGYPQIHLSVREGQGAQIETWLDEGSVDLAFLYRTSPAPCDGDIYLVKTETYLVGAEGDPVTAGADDPVRRAARVAARPFLPAEQLARSVGRIGRRARIRARRRARGRFAQSADAGGRRRRALRAAWSLRDLGGRPQLPIAVVANRRSAGDTAHRARTVAEHGVTTLASRTVMRIAREIATSGASGLPVV